MAFMVWNAVNDPVFGYIQVCPLVDSWIILQKYYHLEGWEDEKSGVD